MTSDQNATKGGSRVAVASDGTAHAVWRQTGTSADIWYATLAPAASSWTGIALVSDDPGSASQVNPDIGIDGTGNLTAVWQDFRANPAQVRARYKAAGGSWAASAIVAADGGNEPALAVRADGAAVVAWYDGVNALFPNVKTSERPTATGSWGTPIQQNEHPGVKPAARQGVALGSAATFVWQSGTNVGGDYDYDILARTSGAAGSDAFAYGYDRLSRLTSVTNPGDDAAYTYDPVGNRLSKTLGAANTTYAYDRADRITAAGSASLTVNAVGATTARGSDTFAYDQVNRLTSATVAGIAETYAYDGDGVRFSRQVGAGPQVRYVTDPTAGLPVTIGDGTRKYVWGLGLAYAVSGSMIEVYHADRLGSTRAITNGSGGLVASYRSDEFGAPVISNGASTQPFRFTGEPLDGNGLTYLRARYYDATLGRLITRDSYGGMVGDPGSLNLYAYAETNPLTMRDPSGRCPIAVTLAVAAGAAGSVLPGAGNLAGAAGGISVGFAMCLFEVAVEALAINAALGEPAGDILGIKPDPIPEPLPAPDPRLSPTYLEEVMWGPFDPYTGEHDPQWQCASKRCRYFLVGVGVTVFTVLVVGNVEASDRKSAVVRHR